jgi:hypothetical protein
MSKMRNPGPPRAGSTAGSDARFASTAHLLPFGRDKSGSGSWGLGDPAAAGLALLRRAHAEASRDPEELTRLH